MNGKLSTSALYKSTIKKKPKARPKPLLTKKEYAEFIESTFIDVTNKLEYTYNYQNLYINNHSGNKVKTVYIDLNIGEYDVRLGCKFTNHKIVLPNTVYGLIPLIGNSITVENIYIKGSKLNINTLSENSFLIDYLTKKSFDSVVNQ